MSESGNKYEYRSYTVEEISHLLEISDEREKAIILILASTGMRVGAVHPLRLKDIKRWAIDKQGNYIYQFNVYSSSSKFRYYTFCTPECALAIDRYLELRKIFGAKLIKTETGWEPSNTFLIIIAFNKKYSNHNPAYFTYALGTQLTPAGQQALLCLGGGAVITLSSLVNPTDAALAAGIQAAGQKVCP